MNHIRATRRGTSANPPCRFDTRRPEPFTDGWQGEDDLPPAKTVVTVDATHSIITRNDSPDVPFDRSINPYRGCEHGCVYCFARPSHAYLGLSPGLDFETRLFAKPDAPRLLEAELRHPRYRCAPIAIGTNTDPYQPIERERRVMRGILEVLSAFRHPVTITTKSALVLRDIDILAPMAAQGLAAVSVSVTTLDRDLSRILEPRASVPAMRLEAIRRLNAAGIPTACMVAPVIPFVTDHEFEAIIAAAKQAGATAASYILLRLPFEVKELFEAWLSEHMPQRKERVLDALRRMRGGKLYDATRGLRYTGTGAEAEVLAQRFRLALKRQGLENRRLHLDATLFRPPPRPGEQLSLPLL